MTESEKLSFYLCGKTYYPSECKIESYIGSYHKTDHYDMITYNPDLFIKLMVEAAIEHGRQEVRTVLKSAIGIT